MEVLVVEAITACTLVQVCPDGRRIATVISFSGTHSKNPGSIVITPYLSRVSGGLDWQATLWEVKSLLISDAFTDRRKYSEMDTDSMSTFVQ